MGITYRRKKRALKYTDQQLNEISTRASRLYRTLSSGNVELIMNDEKYFLLYIESISANRSFYASDPSVASPEPDSARSHYGLTVIQYFNQNRISFVSEQSNPQNCPQARPIETLWFILEQMVYAGGWEAKNVDQLKRRTSKKLSELDIDVAQTMFSNIRKQLRQIADKEPYEACSFLFIVY
ncbi:unnamed protein product [Rotaria magnacalcarata]|uniref:Uncharacterized protein n=1 Tax=Rotaria magnacalcarata TaxID=392030 RepID=A0A816QVM4_9BILA|nr:unnamed protein product [Rotaria magnacalcarata]CAF2105229.1 unnamed protein product [Rotaria magnacalcarata]CAF3806746.1 unnamed protein product [Rotaria magnacalcarata]CAF4166875.1 unnamed protein product [Rotaria magnacalcarata]